MVRKVFGVFCILMAIGGLVGVLSSEGAEATACAVITVIFALVGLRLLLKKRKKPEQNTEIKTTESTNKRRMRMPLLILLVVAIALFASLFYAFINADEIGATPRGNLANTLEITVEEADAILDILEQCGIQDIKSITYDHLLDDMNAEGEVGYRISTKEVNNVILYLTGDKTVSSIRYADKDLYVNGEIIAKLYHDLVIGIE